MNVPQHLKISDLKTLGYSSKEGHIGTGLNTVRHFLVLLGAKNYKYQQTRIILNLKLISL